MKSLNEYRKRNQQVKTQVLDLKTQIAQIEVFHSKKREEIKRVEEQALLQSTSESEQSTSSLQTLQEEYISLQYHLDMLHLIDNLISNYRLNPFISSQKMLELLEKSPLNRSDAKTDLTAFINCMLSDDYDKNASFNRLLKRTSLFISVVCLAGFIAGLACGGSPALIMLSGLGFYFSLLIAICLSANQLDVNRRKFFLEQFVNEQGVNYQSLNTNIYAYPKKYYFTLRTKDNDYNPNTISTIHLERQGNIFYCHIFNYYLNQKNHFTTVALSKELSKTIEDTLLIPNEQQENRSRINLSETLTNRVLQEISQADYSTTLSYSIGHMGHKEGRNNKTRLISASKESMRTRFFGNQHTANDKSTSDQNTTQPLVNRIFAS